MAYEAGVIMRIELRGSSSRPGIAPEIGRIGRIGRRTAERKAALAFAITASVPDQYGVLQQNPSDNEHLTDVDRISQSLQTTVPRT